MTYTQAICKANRLAKKNGRDYFVVRESNEFGEMQFDVCDDFTLDTWYQGIPDRDILFCSAE